MSGAILWSEFLSEANELVKLSDKLGDVWTLVKTDDSEGTTYLVYRQKIYIPTTKCKIKENSTEVEENNIKEELINLEYHVVYSISYQVPVLFFKGCRNDGTQISLEDAWNIFRSSTALPDFNNDNMYRIITQMDHPVLFRPFLALHPCKTHELLTNTPQSKNRIITFLSSIGPYIKLNLNTLYAEHFAD